LTRLAARLFSLMPRVPVLRKGHRAMTLPDFWQRYQSWHTVFSNDLKEQLLVSNLPLIDSFADTFAPYKAADGLDNLTKLLWLDIKAWLPDDLLMKKDRMGMATSIEARVPFLDHHFAETVFNLPSNLKIRRLTGKYMLKKSMERVLPKEIIYRKKQGFPTPISKWMAHDLRQPITDILSATGAADHGYFNRKVVKRLVDEHASGRENHERLLFPLLNFDVWYQTFFQHNSRHEPELTSVSDVA
jgi:asparagine synthase (glutamine-hydrolysing)